MVKEPDPRRLDIRRLAEEGGMLAGELRLDALPRLRDEAAGADAATPITWEARAALGAQPGQVGRPLLRLAIGVTLPLTCQRCLQPVAVPLAVARAFRFEATEEAAAAEDERSDDEDVLVESRRFDLLELLEDELVMALPVVPRHETCPQPIPLPGVDPAFERAQEARENPFAALERLKGRADGDTGL